MPQVRRVSLALAFCVAIGVSVIVGGFLTAIEIFAPPGYSVSFGDSPDISAASAVVFDVETGEVFLEIQGDEVRPLASVTKLVAADALLQEDTLNATTTILWRDVAADGRAGKLAYGEVYTLRTLLFPLLLESSNDAASVFERVMPELVSLMNERTEDDVVFSDASGLSDKNVGSAKSLASFVQSAYLGNKHLFDITTLPQYLSESNGWINNNPFTLIPEYVGGKHGYTPAAGHTAVAVFNEYLGDGRRAIGYVILGTDDLITDMAALREYVKEHVHTR